MELDELKKELNLKLEAGQQQRSAEDFSALLRKNAISVLQKLERSLRFEIGIAIVFTVLCNVVLFTTKAWLYHTLFSILGIAAIIFMVVLFVLLRKMNNTLQTSPVKQNIQQIVRLIEEYKKRYLQLTLFLLPVCFALGVWLSYNDPENVLRPLNKNTIALLMAAMVVSGVIIYLFTRWYLRKLYGNYLQQLKTMLQELNED